MLKYITLGMVFRFAMIACIEWFIVVRLLPTTEPGQRWWVVAVALLLPLLFISLDIASVAQRRFGSDYSKKLRHLRSPAGHEQAEAHELAAKGWRYASSIALAIAGVAIACLYVLIQR